MDDERWEPGMPVLDRRRWRRRGTRRGTRPAPVRPARPDESHLPPSLRGLPPRSVPETSPTPLQKHFVLLSAPALILGCDRDHRARARARASRARWSRSASSSRRPLLLVTTADATLRIWRSAWAWMPVDRGRGLFRLAWVVVSLIFLALIVLAVALVLGA